MRDSFAMTIVTPRARRLILSRATGKMSALKLPKNGIPGNLLPPAPPGGGNYRKLLFRHSQRGRLSTQGRRVFSARR
jgi:hypothetical protein